MNDSKFEWNKHNPPKHGTEKLCVRSHNKCNNLPLLSKWNVQCYDESACTNCTHVFSLDSDEIITSKCAASLWVKCKVFFTVLNENKSNRRLNDHDHRNNVLDSHWPDNTQTHDGLSLITHTLFWFHRQKITNRSNELIITMNFMLKFSVWNWLKSATNPVSFMHCLQKIAIRGTREVDIFVEEIINFIFPYGTK